MPFLGKYKLKGEKNQCFINLKSKYINLID